MTSTFCGPESTLHLTGGRSLLPVLDFPHHLPTGCPVHAIFPSAPVTGVEHNLIMPSQAGVYHAGQGPYDWPPLPLCLTPPLSRLCAQPRGAPECPSSPAQPRAIPRPCPACGPLHLSSFCLQCPSPASWPAQSFSPSFLSCIQRWLLALCSPNLGLISAQGPSTWYRCVFSSLSSAS